MQPDSRAYMDMGTVESGSMVDEDGNGIDDYVDDLRAMRDVMVGQGFAPGDDLMVVEDEGGTHNERYWAQRFPGTLQLLFPPPPETGVHMCRFQAGDVVEQRRMVVLR